MFALLRSHSKRSINHNGSVCFLMKSAPSLIRHLWHSIEHFGIAIYLGKNGTRLLFRFYVESATFNTSKDCRVGRDFEQLPAFCRQEFSKRWLGWICNVYRWPVLRRGDRCAPTEGYNHAVSPHMCWWGHRWMVCNVQHMAKGRAAWYMKEKRHSEMCSNPPSITKQGF